MLPSDPEHAPDGGATSPEPRSTDQVDVPVGPVVPGGLARPERRRGWAFAASMVLVAVMGGGALFMSGYSIGRDAGRVSGGSVAEADAWKPFWNVYDAVTNRYPLEPVDQTKLIEGAIRDLTAITGQKPTVTKARKSIAQFKLREGMPIGAHVTLRGDRMWEFLDRLVTFALPRIRDFRGLSPKQFDGNGNYTFGLSEQSVFHEIDQDKIDRVRGMDITVVTTATNDDEGRALLKKLGFPFKEGN